MKIIRYEYQSCFAPYIKQFLQEKRSVGFAYESEEWKLKHFDDFLCERIRYTAITKQGTGEKMGNITRRRSIIYMFSTYFYHPSVCVIHDLPQ